MKTHIVSGNLKQFPNLNDLFASGLLIPISVKGSLFYDIDHPPGHVSFGNYKPTTAWEIHPVQKIKFLDE